MTLPAKLRDRWSIGLAGMLVAAGLGARLALLPVPGMHDLDLYERWGEGVWARGLFLSFEGLYFPLQYQLFGLAAGLRSAWGESFSFWLKALNLTADLAILVVLWRLAGSAPRRWWLLGLYWLNPWCLVMFALGYCDSQFALCVLLFLVWYRDDGTIRRALAAGVPLAAAFLMKPQALVVVLMLGFLGIIRLLRERTMPWRLVAAGVPAGVLFCAYSLFFWGEGKQLDFLAHVYLRTSNVMPTMTANMLNVWHPLVTLIHPHRFVWAMRDDVALVGNLTFRDVALVLTLTLLLGYAIAAVWQRKLTDVTAAIAFAALAVPFVMTGAHENHLFLATTLMTLLWMYGRLSRIGLGALVMFMVLCTVNMVAHYRFGRNPLSSHVAVGQLSQLWTLPWLRLLCGGCMVGAGVLGLSSLYRVAAGRHLRISAPLTYGPLVVTAVLVLVVYATAAVSLRRLRQEPTYGMDSKPPPTMTVLSPPALETYTRSSGDKSAPTWLDIDDLPTLRFTLRDVWESPDVWVPGPSAEYRFLKDGAPVIDWTLLPPSEPYALPLSQPALLAALATGHIDSDCALEVRVSDAVGSGRTYSIPFRVHRSRAASAVR